MVGHELVDLCVQGCSPYVGFALSFEREEGLKSMARMWTLLGNSTEFSDTEGVFGKRCLFCLTASFPGIRLLGVRVKRWVQHFVL